MGHPAQEIPSLNFPSVQPIKARRSAGFSSGSPTIDSFPSLPPPSTPLEKISPPVSRRSFDDSRLLFRILDSRVSFSLESLPEDYGAYNRPRSTGGRVYEPATTPIYQVNVFFSFLFFLSFPVPLQRSKDSKHRLTQIFVKLRPW